MRFTRSLAALGLSLAMGTAAAGLVGEGNTIQATASGVALFGAGDGYASAGSTAAASLSGAFGDVEFLSDDGNLFFDFLGDGTLEVYGFADTINASVDFVFTTLSQPLASVQWLAAPLAGLSFDIVDAQTLRVTLSGAAFSSAAGPVAVAIDVPEPATGLLVAIGLGLLAVRRGTV
jgi:hypothetical protein